MGSYQRYSLLEVRHLIGSLVLPTPLNDAILVHSKIASSLPSIPALGRSVPYTLLFAQLVQIAQTSGRKDVEEARDSEAICGICLPFSVHDNLQIGLRVLRCVG